MRVLHPIRKYLLIRFATVRFACSTHSFVSFGRSRDKNRVARNTSGLDIFEQRLLKRFMTVYCVVSLAIHPGAFLVSYVSLHFLSVGSLALHPPDTLKFVLLLPASLS